MSNIKLHPDVIAIKRAAPKWAVLMVILANGKSIWQEMTPNPWWGWTDMQFIHGDEAVIDLRTGAVSIQDEFGKVITVPQSQWVAARKRKGWK